MSNVFIYNTIIKINNLIKEIFFVRIKSRDVFYLSRDYFKFFHVAQTMYNLGNCRFKIWNT